MYVVQNFLETIAIRLLFLSYIHERITEEIDASKSVASKFSHEEKL